MKKKKQQIYVCPKCGKETDMVSFYKDGSQMYVHGGKATRFGFVVTDKCLVK